MRYANDPGQERLFDVFQTILHPIAYKRIRGGWQHLFRERSLELTPVKTVGQHFAPVMCQRTKELYSMCGLISVIASGTAESRERPHERGHYRPFLTGWANVHNGIGPVAGKLWPLAVHWVNPRATDMQKNKETRDMSKKTWTLTDVDQDVFIDEISISPDDVDGAATGYSVTKRTLRGGLRDAVDVIEVDNGEFRFTIIPTRGMGLWRASLGDLRLGWQSPVKGPVHPKFVQLTEASGLGWLDGFDELLVRCGLESNGAPEFNLDGTVRHGLHGKIANLPAHKVEVTVDGDSGEISVSGVVNETRLFFNKLELKTTYTTRVGQSGVTLTDTVTNISAETSELELLYHVNFGVPLLGPGSKAVVPVAKMAPRDDEAVGNLADWDTYGPETPGSAEAVFFFDLTAGADGQTQTLLRNATGSQGVSLKFNKNQLPCFTLWKSRKAVVDGYVTGLEPAVNFPNARPFEKEKGRVVTLGPSESRTLELTLEGHADAESVSAAEQAVAKLQKGVTPEILDRPNPEWSPV